MPQTTYIFREQEDFNAPKQFNQIRFQLVDYEEIQSYKKKNYIIQMLERMEKNRNITDLSNETDVAEIFKYIDILEYMKNN